MSIDMIWNLLRQHVPRDIPLSFALGNGCVCLLACILIAISTLNLQAQVDTGTISGAVRDAFSAVIQGAAVKVENSETGITVSLLTNSEGFYSATSLKAGSYTVSASSPGFKTVTHANVPVRVQDRIDIDLQLPVGESSTSVAVESQVPTLETESSSLGQVVEEQTIKNLPLNGRNYIQLATLAPGTSPSNDQMNATLL